MKIETKLNINDKCYVIYNNRIIKSKVYNIEIDIGESEDPEIKYWFRDIGWVSENFVFTTKEEILKFLEETIVEM